MCLAAVEVCGCTAWVSVLGYGHDDDAYREAAREVKRGCEIRHMLVDEWKARGWHCTAHPKGPPWWKSNGGKGKRPAAETLGLGL
jgi:hypothetical protein